MKTTIETVQDRPARTDRLRTFRRRRKETGVEWIVAMFDGPAEMSYRMARLACEFSFDTPRREVADWLMRARATCRQRITRSVQ